MLFAVNPLPLVCFSVHIGVHTKAFLLVIEVGSVISRTGWQFLQAVPIHVTILPLALVNLSVLKDVSPKSILFAIYKIALVR